MYAEKSVSILSSTTRTVGYVERFSAPVGFPYVESFPVENGMKQDPSGEINDPWRSICGNILCWDFPVVCLID